MSTTFVPSPLFLEGWLEYNRERWGLQPSRWHYHPENTNLPFIQAVFYLTKKGKICLPPRNPYLALSFQSTPSQHSYHLSRQWQQAAGLLVAEMRHRGLANTVMLPPTIEDVRPWQWSGFRAAVRYTFHIAFPFDLATASKEVRRHTKKAQQAGFRAERADDMTELLDCLHDTEIRQGYKHEFTKGELIRASNYLGDDHFRLYTCYAPNGEPASAQVILFSEGAPALAWVLGTKTNHLTTGATQLLMHAILADLQHCGAQSLDFAGANLRTVATSKAAWGGTLVPYAYLEDYGFRQLAKWGRDWWRYLRYSQRARGK